MNLTDGAVQCTEEKEAPSREELLRELEERDKQLSALKSSLADRRRSSSPDIFDQSTEEEDNAKSDDKSQRVQKKSGDYHVEPEERNPKSGRSSRISAISDRIPRIEVVGSC